MADESKSLEAQVRDYIAELKQQGRSAAIDYFLAQDFKTQMAMVKLYQDLPVDAERQITESNARITTRRTGTDFVRFLDGANKNKLFQSFGHDRVVVEGGNDNVIRQGNAASRDQDMAYMQGGNRNWIKQAGGNDYAAISGGKDGMLMQGWGADALEISGGSGYEVWQQWGADSLDLIGGTGHTIYQDHPITANKDVLRVDAVTGVKGVGSFFQKMFPGSYGEITANLGTGPTNNKVYQGRGNDTLYMNSWVANGNFFSGDSSFTGLTRSRGVDTLVIKPEDVENLQYTLKGKTLTITYRSGISGTQTTNTFESYEFLQVGDQKFNVIEMNDTPKLTPLSNVVKPDNTEVQKR